MRHDDAIWRSHPSELVAGSRQEVRTRPHGQLQPISLPP
ncbi:unnamed protein product [Ectocarpus sp. 13 AM-2016]